MQPIYSHTALRGIAALMVVYGHYTYVFARDIHGLNFFVPHTHLGVDLFFILSGFILFHVYATTFRRRLTVKKWFRFQIRRLARIYPLHIATLLMVLALIRFEVKPESFDILLMNLALVHSWGFTDRFEFNAPSWSISCEFMAYLLFPLLVVVTKDRIGTLALFLAALTAYAVLWRFGHGSLDLEEIGPIHGILRAVGGFPIGMLVAMAHRAEWPKVEAAKPTLQWVGVVGLAACIALQLPEMTYIPMFALLIFATASNQGGLVRGLQNPALVWLGEISYAVYLIQWPIMLSLFSLRPKLSEHFGPDAVDLIALGYFVVMLFLLSVMSGRYFERYFIIWGRSRTGDLDRRG